MNIQKKALNTGYMVRSLYNKNGLVIPYLGMTSIIESNKPTKTQKTLGSSRIDVVASTKQRETGKDAAIKHFKYTDKIFYTATRAHHASLPVKLSRKNTRVKLFESLVSIVIAQQLGTAAADTIYARVVKACKGRLTSESVLRTHSVFLRKAGLSGTKTKTLKAIAMSIENNSLDLLSLHRLPEEAAAEILLSVWGLGPWSVDMFMMHSLGREDVFSAGDLGLVRAMEAIYNLPKNSPRSSLLAIAKKWSPYRTYASLLLWKTRDAT